MELQARESSSLPMLTRQLDETSKSINNKLNAIQQDILTTSTKQRLDKLEETKSELEINILQEQMQMPLLTREQLNFWIHRFRIIDISLSKYIRSPYIMVYILAWCDIIAKKPYTWDDLKNNLLEKYRPMAIKTRDKRVVEHLYKSRRCLYEEPDFCHCFDAVFYYLTCGLRGWWCVGGCAAGAAGES